MSQIEFLLTLLSIIVGLGLADLARGLRNLVRPHQPVHWHWLPLVWTGIVFLLVANFWWGYFNGLQMEVWGNYFAFLLLLGEVMSLYLLCAFALPDLKWQAPQSAAAQRLPDEPPASAEKALDLEQFYFSTSHRRWFFGVFLVLLAFVEATETAEQYSGYDVMLWDVGETLRLILATAAGVLIATDREIVHTSVTLGVLVGLIVFIFRYASGLE
jgi:hypothetical protein